MAHQNNNSASTTLLKEPSNLSTKVREYLSATTATQQAQILSQIQTELQEKQIPLLRLIECLGEPLVSSEELYRAKGVCVCVFIN
jgi:hypothetical protein